MAAECGHTRFRHSIAFTANLGAAGGVTERRAELNITCEDCGCKFAINREIAASADRTLLMFEIEPATKKEA